MTTRDDLESEKLSLRPLLPWLLLAAALSVTMMVLGAGRGDRLLPALSAGLLMAFAVGTSLGLNAPLWSGSLAQGKPHAVKSAYRGNVWLAALVYGWGASALFGMYSLSDLVWQHAFQYATGAALFSAGIALYGLHIGRRKSEPMPRLLGSALHGAAAGGGVVYLVGAGKLATHRGDWAANEVFLWGGLAIVSLCAISALTEWKANQAPPTRS